MRLFTAIILPDAIREMIQIPDPAAMKVVPRTNLHITLRYIGETDDSEVEDICRALRSVHFEPFDVTVTGAGCFPGRKNPRVLWIGAGPAGKLESVYNRVDAALRPAGAGPGDKRFHPHITVARPRPGSDKAVREYLQANNDKTFGTFRFEGFVLYQSILKKDGAEYIELEKFSV